MAVRGGAVSVHLPLLLVREHNDVGRGAVVAFAGEHARVGGVGLGAFVVRVVGGSGGWLCGGGGGSAPFGAQVHGFVVVVGGDGGGRVDFFSVLIAVGLGFSGKKRMG